MTKGLREMNGASAVEFALVLPILIVLLMGMFTGAITLNRWLQMNHAAREGVRFAATLPQSDPDWHHAVLLRTYEASARELTFSDPSVDLCTSLLTEGGNPQRVTVSGGAPFTGDADAYITANASLPTAGHCYADALPPGQPRVQVVAERDAVIQGVFFILRPRLSSQSVARYEDPLSS